MYAEDLDIGWRLHRAGWPTAYVPSAHVAHVVSAATTQAFGEEREERAQARSYAWMLRRRGVVSLRAGALLNVAGAAARHAVYRVAARIRPGRYSAARDSAARWARIHRTGLQPADRLRELR
jgi:GT2 family glycosyltransferase